MPQLNHVRDKQASTNVIEFSGSITYVITIAERLKLAREEQNLTQEEVAARAGVAQGTIANIESSHRKSPRELMAIASAVKVNPEWLKSGKGPKAASESGNVVPAPIGGIRIPVINYVQAGMWSGVIDGSQHGDADDWLTTDQQFSRSAFALEIKGDSMLPKFEPGDRVIIDPDVAPLPGDFVVAKNGEEEATFKKYRPRGADASGETVFELVPLNDDYAPMRSDLMPIRIVGTMVEHRKYRRAR